MLLNEERAHSALDWMTPAEFAMKTAINAAKEVSKSPETAT